MRAVLGCRQVPISALEADQFEALFTHLIAMLGDAESVDQPRFQPITDSDSAIPEPTRQWFVHGAEVAVGEGGWRRVWVVQDAAAQIIAHVDLRATADHAAMDRCLLGMGVRGGHRRLGLGTRLLDFVERWAADQGLRAIDLEVLAENLPAIALYRRLGYQPAGEGVDVDGRALLQMSKALR